MGRSSACCGPTSATATPEGLVLARLLKPSLTIVCLDMVAAAAVLVSGERGVCRAVGSVGWVGKAGGADLPENLLTLVCELINTFKSD